PGLGREIELWSGVGGVLEVAPGSSGKVVEVGSHDGEVFAVLIRGPETAAGGQDGTDVFGQALVNPQQVCLHGLLVVRRGEADGTTIFAIRGVREFMGQQAGVELALGFVDEATLGGAAVVGFMVFESEVGDVVTEGVEEMIVEVVLRSEESACLSHKILVEVPDFCWWFEGSGAIGSDVQFGGGMLGKRNHLQVLAGENWGINEDIQRLGAEVEIISVGVAEGQRGRVFPAVRNFEGGTEGDVLGLPTLGIEQDLVPA